LGHIRHLRLAAPTGGGRQELDKAGMCVSECVCQCQCASIGARDLFVRGMPAAVSGPSQTPPCTATLYQEQHRQAATHAPPPPPVPPGTVDQHRACEGGAAAQLGSRTCNAAQQRRLATARRSQQAHNLAAVHAA
jgi:hypothetical protein